MQSGILVKNDGGYINSFAEKDYILEEDGALIGMDFVADLKDKGYLEPDLMSTNIESFKTDLATGRVAMAFLADWLPPQIVTAGAAAEDLGMMPAPYAKCILMDKDFSYAVSNNSKHKPLAKAFLQWLWEDGRYAKATALDTPRVGGDTPDAPWLEDLFSFGLPVVENQPLSDAYKDVVAKAQYDFDWIMVQEYLLTSNRDAFVEATNRRWAEARK
jgi:raffinose/stachyose/melibiose transport system substrate-binding protein